MSEKKLPPSEQKLRQARERGQMPISRDLVGTVKVFAIMELAFACEPWARGRLRQFLDTAIAAVGQPKAAGMAVLGDVIWQGFAMMAALACLAAALAAVATLAQTRMNVAIKAFEAGPKKLDPAANLMQIFSAKKLMMLGMGLLKVSAVLAVCHLSLRSQLPDLVRMHYLSPEQAWEMAAGMMHTLVRNCTAVLLAGAALDYVVQRVTTMRSLRMDHSEVKREHKDNEGDPHLKSERRSLGRAMQNAPPRKSAPVPPNAVVTNPEHIAIGLYFDHSFRQLPRLVRKEHGEKALQIREWAAREGVPVIRFVALARLLLAIGRVDEPVPGQTLRAVAAVGAAVRELASAPWKPGEEFELAQDVADALLPQAVGAAPRQGPMPWQAPPL